MPSRPANAPSTGLISVVDDDPSIRRSLTNLFDSLGLSVAAFASAEEFLNSDLSATECLVLDVELPGMSGLDLLDHLTQGRYELRVVMLTAHADAHTRKRAAELGASAFLSKPFRSDELMRSVECHS
jgi:FixJ family two-component response regulator